MNEKIDDYHCAGNHQGIQLMMVSFDPTLKKNQRLLCQKCLDDLKPSTKVEGFQKTLDSIQEIYLNRVNQQQFLIDYMIRFIEPIQKLFQSTREIILKNLDTLINFTVNWKMELQQISKSIIVYNFHDELETLIQRQQYNKQQAIFEEINKLNHTYTIMIINQLQTLKNDPFKEIEQKLDTCEEMLNSQFLNYNNQIKKNPISIRLNKISKVESEKGISNIVFNGQMMITTNESKVGVWNLNQGNLKFQTSFIAHNSQIKCAILICNQNFYIITTADKTIKIFQRINEIQWKTVFEFSKIKNSINCMIINRNETYLFTSSENVITVWRLNLLQNQMLTGQQSLEQHKWAINAISLNKSENKMISCSKDQNLIVWGLNRNNQWEYKYDVRQSNQIIGNALYFLTDTQFILVSGELYCEDFVYVYEEQGGQFQEVLNKILKLPRQNQNGFSSSSAVYIEQQKNIILISQKSNIYLIRIKSDGSLSIVNQFSRTILNYQQSQSLAQDGKYLVYSQYENQDDRNYFLVKEITYS